MAKVLDYDLEVSEFELQSRNYVYFRTNTFRKGIKMSYLLRFGLNSVTAVLRHEGLSKKKKKKKPNH